MKIKMIGAVITGMMLVSSVVLASSSNEFIVTSAKSKAAEAIGLDFMNDGAATALQLRFAVNKDAKIDLSKCVAALPDSHDGQCAFKNGVLTVLVYSDVNALLPSGLVSIGSIKISERSSRGAKKDKVKLTEALAFDVLGQEIQSSYTQDQIEVLK